MADGMRRSRAGRGRLGAKVALALCLVVALPPTAARAGSSDSSGKWEIVNGLAVGREFHTATRLNDGRVLVAGGRLGGVGGSPTNTAELFNNLKKEWANTGALGTPRMFHTATLLPNGKVLVAGGLQDATTTESNSAELYDPATGTWTATGVMNTARALHTATLLTNGLVLVTGGQDGTNARTASAELYDPASGTWTPTGSLNVARYQHTATLLSNGRVLVAGGLDAGGAVLAHAELFNPASGIWTPTAPMDTPRYVHAAERTLLPGGKVLVTGGLDDDSPVTATPTAELFDPAGTWSPTTTFMTRARYFHTETLLPDGRVLVVGGAGGPEVGFNRTETAELFDPATGVFSSTSSLSLPRYQHTATLIFLDKDRQKPAVLVVGGSNGGAPFTRVELFTPKL